MGQEEAPPIAEVDWCYLLVTVAVHGVHAPSLAGYYIPVSVIRKVNLYANMYL